MPWILARTKKKSLIIRRGYQVYVGKIDDMEIDFVAQNSQGNTYIQVSASVRDENTLALDWMLDNWKFRMDMILAIITDENWKTVYFSDYNLQK